MAAAPQQFFSYRDWASNKAFLGSCGSSIRGSFTQSYHDNPSKRAVVLVGPLSASCWTAEEQYIGVVRGICRNCVGVPVGMDRKEVPWNV